MNKPLKLRADTIFLGCSHIDHKQPFIWQKRGFDSPEAHAECIIREVALYAKSNPGAQMIHLGDGFLNSTPERARAWFAKMQIPILYVWGNHEGPTSQLYKAEVARLGFGSVEVYPLVMDNVTYLGNEATLSIEKQEIVVSHFPRAIWNQSHHGIWHLHSHCHGSFPDSLPDYLGAKRLDVGVEVALKYGGKPYLTFAQVKAIMTRKQIHEIDHHNSSTN